MLREHQSEFDNICREIVGGAPIEEIIAAVTPGGGKSALPVIAAHQLIANGFADKICWIVPRTSLAKQAELAFGDSRMRGILGHNYEIRKASNDTDPCRGHIGYVTTYHAINANPELHAHEFRRHRYVLVLDEPHHIAAGGEWHRSLRPLYDLAKLRVLMSGSLERGSGDRIAFLSYKPMINGRSEVDLDNSLNRRTVKYNLIKARREGAVISTSFHQLNGTAKYVDREGKENLVGIDSAGERTAEALYTALHTEYAHKLLFNAVEHWRQYRENFNGRSKMLVVAPSITLAKSYLGILRDLDVESLIATSEESAEAALNIDKLKGDTKPECNALVTVAMAYEGLDCPAVTHIACLTHIRSKPWIEQMIARATRFDDKAADDIDQEAHIFAPDDEYFSACIKEIRAAEDAFILEKLKRPRPEDDPPGGVGVVIPIVPLESVATTTRASNIDNANIIAAEEYDRLGQTAKQAGIYGIGLEKLQIFLRLNNVVTPASIKADDQNLVQDIIRKTPSQRENALKAQIKDFISLQYRGDGDRIKDINRYLIKRTNKSRSKMTVSELQSLWDTRAEWIRNA